VTMALVNVYKVGAWHDFVETKGQWLGTEPFVLIIPENQDKERIVKAFGATNHHGVLTIPELIEHYVKTLGKKGLISRHGLESILGSIIAESTVSYLKIKNYKQGYVKALTDFIFHFRQSAATDLQTALVDLNQESRFTWKENDLLKIYAQCETKLGDYGFDLKSGLEALVQSTDAATIYNRLGLNPNDRIVFFGFDFITPLEAEFIFTVFQKAAGVVWLSCEDTAASEQAVRIHKSIFGLLERSKSLITVQKIAPPYADEFFVTLANTLFSSTPNMPDTPGASIPAVAPGLRLLITKENSRFSEVVSIARQIKRLAAGGVPLAAIRIVASLYDTYCSLIQEIFPEYGISFDLANGVPLLQLPLAALIHNLVIQSVHASPYPLREKALSSPYVRFRMPIKPEDLVKYQEYMGVAILPEDQLKAFLKIGVQFQLDFNYTRNIRAKAYRKIRSAPETAPLEVVRQYFESLEWPADEIKREGLCQCLIQFYLLGQAEKAFYVWQAQMSGMEFKAAVLELLDRFNIESNIQFSECSIPDSPELRIQQRDGAVLKQIGTILTELETLLASLNPSATAKFSLNELVRLFSRCMSEASFILETSGGVTVQPVTAGQYQKWDYTFIAGLVDGEFPGMDDFNFLQPRKEGLGLGYAYTSVDHARNRFYHQIRSTVRGLFLSLPLAHNGRRLPPSPFIREVEKCLSPDSALAIGSTDSTVLYSLREKFIAIGQKVDYRYDEAVPLLTELKKNDETLFAKVMPILRFDGLGLSAAAFSEFDGIFGKKASTLGLLGQALASITFTPATLERYAACPMRFFFDDILNLKTEPDYHPDLTEAGNFVCSVLRQYTEKACETGSIPEDAGLCVKKFAEERLQQQYQDNADAFQMRFRKQFLAGLATKETGRPGLFSAFLVYEKEAPDLIRPYLANLGGSVTLTDELAVQVIVDRVDLTKAGDYCLLFSYTTADTGNPGQIFRGLRFDLPLLISCF
jgi:ATP-dependent helicase/DNAse subunit B